MEKLWYRVLVAIFLASMEAKRFLPSGPLIVAYANWAQCDDKMLRVAENGANVLIWFSVNLGEVKGNAAITGSNQPDYQCVAEVAAKLRDRGLATSHLISIGGWNSPHPVTTPKLSGAEWWAVWEHWNQHVVARPSLGFHGFDGIDWDLEGNDDPESPYNQFTLDTLDIMGTMSVKAKQAGYVVGMAPAQSYLDVTTNKFDLSLRHGYPSFHHDFKYHGMNTYAYVLAKYKHTTLQRTCATNNHNGPHPTDTRPDDEVALPDLLNFIQHESETEGAGGIFSSGDGTQQQGQEGDAVGQGGCSADVVTPTFDFVCVQLYEGWSRANYYVGEVGIPPAKYLSDLIKNMEEGWTVEFAEEPTAHLPSQLLQVPATQLVIGLANGWTGLGKDQKFLLLLPESLREAYEGLSQNEKPKGFMFWNANDEGLTPPGTNTPLYLASSLNGFLQTR
eukprot:TRINITY_DN48526_c0_g1_i1.p1 TRINITY_DN48526_c0_g1~~TRINITY_DN48526_c0_g1_i1.p1  ORF type:complete len:447 (-),score=44.38 TRINITY_DN48526_c0_g1_i1:58-1398(-)